MVLLYFCCLLFMTKKIKLFFIVIIICACFMWFIYFNWRISMLQYTNIFSYNNKKQKFPFVKKFCLFVQMIWKNKNSEKKIESFFYHSNIIMFIEIHVGLRSQRRLLYKMVRFAIQYMNCFHLNNCYRI